MLIGGSYGAGNYAMAGRAYQPRFLWMWPNAKISVMGSEQASDVLTTLKLDQYKKRGESITSEQINKLKQPIQDKFNKESNPYYASARLWDDGIINPINTRKILIQNLKIIKNSPIKDMNFPVFRM